MAQQYFEKGMGVSSKPELAELVHSFTWLPLLHLAEQHNLNRSRVTYTAHQLSPLERDVRSTVVPKVARIALNK